jgi:uncharacterized protein YjeT (DUF2065 family)
MGFGDKPPCPRFFCARLTEDASRLNGWQQIAVGVALVFVIEGILPFAAPRLWRDMVRQVSELDDRSLRVFGLSSMLFGLGLLYLVN